MKYTTFANVLNDIVDFCYHRSVKAGWWDIKEGIDRQDVDDYLVGTKISLIHSEISEALEGYRKDLMDDHLPERKMIEVELADAIIRIADLAGYLGIDLGGAFIEKMEYNTKRKDHKREVRKLKNGKRI